MTAGYRVGPIPEPARLMSALTGTSASAEIDEGASSAPSRARKIATKRFFRLRITAASSRGFRPPSARPSLSAFGRPEDDPRVRDGAFRFPIVRSGALVIALQPDRGRAASRKSDYHDVNLPPRHAYLAFYLWLREVWRIDAMIHCGTHGTLEWLPGKSVALSQDCAPEIVLGAVPVVYPFIVNNPGEAAQAKRRIARRHHRPYDAAPDRSREPWRARSSSRRCSTNMRARNRSIGVARACFRRRSSPRPPRPVSRKSSGSIRTAIRWRRSRKLDAWLCDLKEMRIGDGLHVFAESTPSEMTGLLRALDGRFVEPGPAGAPSRGRLDVLPTGRNLFTIDPRAVPTRTAWEIGAARRAR